jgi:hypothetical protein
MISRARYLDYYFLFLWRIAKWVVNLSIAFWVLMLFLALFNLAYPKAKFGYGWGAVVTEILLIAMLVWVRRFLVRAVDRLKIGLHPS